MKDEEGKVIPHPSSFVEMMGTDIRYLVVTLVAVFLALALGTFYGAGLTNEPSVKELSKTIDRLNESFQREKEGIRKELDEKTDAEKTLKGQVETYDKFFRASFPHLIHQRLMGKRIALIHTTGQANFQTLRHDLMKVLQQAGATVASVTFIHSDRAQVASDVLQRLAQAYQIPETSEQRIWSGLSQTAAKAIALGDNTGVVNHLTKAGFLESSGDYAQPAHAVVLMGGDEEEDSDVVQRVDIPIIKTLRELNMPCVGCETTDVTRSFMEDYQRAEISTVDNVNTPMGQAALVLSLAGFSGRCGAKETAESLLPSVK